MRIIRKRELKQKIGYSDMHISRLEAAGRFPRRIQLGPNSVGWLDSEISDWIQQKVAERDATPKKRTAKRAAAREAPAEA